MLKDIHHSSHCAFTLILPLDSNAIGMFELFEKVWLRQKRTTEVHAQGMHDYVER